MKKLIIVVIILAIAAGGLYYLSTLRKNEEPYSEGYLDKAQELMNDKYYSKALEQYKLAIEADPSDTDAYTGAAEIYLLKGQYSSAIDLLEGAENVVENAAEIYYLRGNVLMGSGNVADAIGNYENANKKNKEYWENTIALVKAYGMVENKSEESVKVLEETSNEDSKGWRNFYLALFSYPDSGDMISFLNEVSKSESDDVKARKENLLKVAQKVQSDPEDTLQNNTLIAYEYINADLYQSAIPILNSIISENDEYYASYLYLGVCYQKLDNQDKAIENYEKSTDVDPKQLDSWVFLAQAYAVKNDQKNAVDAYQEALSVDKENESVRLDYARALAGFGLYSQAAREYEELIDLNSKEVMKYKIELAELTSEKLNDPKSALKLSKEVVDDWEGFQISDVSFQARALDAIGWAFKLDEQKDEATKYLKRALEADPYQADIYYHLGVIYSEIENFIDAQEYFERAIDLDLEGEISAKASNELDKMINEKDN
ncbi:MAG: tetratricopeptide repeat protein [Candidatus Dojkabacteria bacterium]|jgi:tetratricopeptide (TPR) repeat protein|nr:tetratricopeptide repeat protein [Candidatus Dojkabacteria bacterium]